MSSPARAIPPQESFADLLFPLQGIDLLRAFFDQRGLTTLVGVNVRAFEPSTLRDRGGSRPGTVKFNQRLPLNYVSGSRHIQHLAVVVDPDGTALLANYDELPRLLYDPSSDGPPESWGYTPLDTTPITWDPKTTRNPGDTFPSGGTLITPNKNSKKGIWIDWNDPADVPSGTILGVTQLNAVAKDPKTFAVVPGTYTYTPPQDTVLHAGNNQPLLVHFSPTGTNDYVGGNKTVHIDVTTGGPIAFMQSRSAAFDVDGSPDTVHAVTLDYTDPVTAGNFLVVAVETFQGDPTALVPTTVTVSDSEAGTWIQAGSYVNPWTPFIDPAKDCISLWYRRATITGGLTISVLPSSVGINSQPGIVLAIVEYLHVKASSPLDATASASATTSAPTTANVVVSEAGELVIAICAHGGGDFDVPTVAAPYTLREALAGFAILALADHFPVASAETAVFGLTFPDVWVALTASFKREP